MKIDTTSLLKDFLGALSGTAVILPQSMGLGVVLFSVMGLDASSGALAGIIGAAVLSLVSGIFGATLGMFSAPNGPVTMLLVGVFTIMAGNGATSANMLLTLSAILILTGLFQIIFSLLGGAKLVKYIPYPVIVGLVSGIGILMIKSQLKLFLSPYQSIDDRFIASIPLIIAVVTMLTIIITPKISKKLPAALVGLFVGSLVYALLNSLYLDESFSSWVVGSIPGIDSLHFGFSLVGLHSLNIEEIVTASLALTVLATTDCLVTAIVADSQTNTRHNGRKEIVAQGIGQIIVGLLGGLGGGGTKGATLVNIQSGGGRYSSIFSGLVFVLLILFFGSLGRYLPLSVLGAIIVIVGFGMINFNIIDWLRYKKSRVDAFIALVVLLSVILIDLVSAVGIGIVISMLVYLRMQIKADIIHRRTNASRRTSLVKRTDAEKAILQEYGEKVVMLELTGNLFFATADKLLEEMDPYMREGYIVILHFQRVTLMDLSGVIILLQIASRLKNIGSELVLCHMHKELGLGKKINRALESIDKKHSIKIRTFINIDSAFEYGENRLLVAHGIELRSKDSFIDIEENQLCKNISPNIVEIIQKLSREIKLNKGETLFEQGDMGDSLFMVLKGEVNIELFYGKDDYKLFGKYGAGTYFGEISFLNPGERTASAVCKADTTLLEFKQADLISLESKEKEELSLALLFELGSTLGEELRHSAREIRRLEAV